MQNRDLIVVAIVVVIVIVLFVIIKKEESFISMPNVNCNAPDSGFCRKSNNDIVCMRGDQYGPYDKSVDCVGWLFNGDYGYYYANDIDLPYWFLPYYQRYGWNNNTTYWGSGRSHHGHIGHHGHHVIHHGSGSHSGSYGGSHGGSRGSHSGHH